MKELSLFFILSLMGLFSGCGKQGTQTSFEIKFTSSAVASFQGGVLLLGQNSTSGEEFQEAIDSTTFEKTISNGQWSFVAFAWDGASHFLGNLKCSQIINQDISSTSTDVSLSLDSANCLNTTHYFENGSIDTMPSPNVPYNFYIKTCNANESQTTLDSGSCSYTGLASGIKLMAASTIGTTATSFPLQTSCLKLNSGNHYSSFKIPMLHQIFKNPFWRVKIYYSSVGSSCSGDNCCQDREETLDFPQGFNNPSQSGTLANGYYTSFLFNEPESQKKLLFNPIGVVSYNNCEAVQVDYYEQGSPSTAINSFTYTPNCSSNCQFFSDNTCSTSVSSLTFPANNSSDTFYMRVHSGEAFTLSQGGDNNEIAGDQLTSIVVNASYNDIDANFLNNGGNFYLYGTTTMSIGMLTGGAYGVYTTGAGNKGKWYINSRYMTTTTDDTLDFDFITWDSGGNIVAQGTNIISVQCSSAGSCKLDFDVNTGLNTPNTAGASDVWWGGNGAIVQFSMQAGVNIRYMGP